MNKRTFSVTDRRSYAAAGPTDLVELNAAPGNNPLFLPKWLVESVVYGIVAHEFIHLSGPTGSAKSSLLEALYLVPDNFAAVCEAIGFAPRDLVVYPIEMTTYETPGELYQRRALRDGTTFDERSRLVEALLDANRRKQDSYALVWLREMGRVHTASVQGGLLNLMTRTDIVLPDGTHLDGGGIAWVADSNYQAERDATHTLVTFDDALRRRFSLNITLDYLQADQEMFVLVQLSLEGQAISADEYDIIQVVKLGQAIRAQRSEGNLQSVTPPTIYSYLAYLRMRTALPHLDADQVAMATLLGNAAFEDRKHVLTVLSQVYGLESEDVENPELAGNML